MKVSNFIEENLDYGDNENCKYTANDRSLQVNWLIAAVNG